MVGQPIVDFPEDLQLMHEYTCAPVLLTVFNRPHETRQVLARLKEVRPQKIFIAADGPREERAEDQHLCEEVRGLISQEITWPAAVVSDFAPRNLGLRRRMASAVSWALEHEDRVIVLEDDCLPAPSFFRFCTELLEHYSTDHRVGVVTGDNFQSEGFDRVASYYFSRYPHCWGWATWRRSWEFYDDEMFDWPAVRDTGWLKTLFPHPLEELYWRKIFDETYSNNIPSWAYRWTYSCWRHDLLTATPARNLVTNIGTGVAASNTRDPEEGKHGLKAHAIAFPLVHPAVISRDPTADDRVQQLAFGRAKDSSLGGQVARLLSKIKRRLTHFTNSPS
jgi:hypothetical protein